MNLIIYFTFLLALGAFVMGIFMKENNPKIVGVIRFDLDKIKIKTENKEEEIFKTEIKKITTHLNGYNGLKRFMLLRLFESDGFYNELKVTANNKTYSFYLFVSNKREYEELKNIKTWLHA